MPYLAFFQGAQVSDDVPDLLVLQQCSPARHGRHGLDGGDALDTHSNIKKPPSYGSEAFGIISQPEDEVREGVQYAFIACGAA